YQATRDEFMSYLLASITARITEHVKSQMPLILPKEVSNFAPSVIKSMVTELLEHVVLTKESSQPKFTYEAAASLTHFELKKILIEKIDESQSYLTATEHRECYDGLIKSYDLNKSLFSTHDKVYPLKRSQKDKDKYEDPSAGSDRGLKKKKTSKDAEPTIGPRTKESKSGSSKGKNSQSKSSGKSVQSEELEFEVVDSDMPQDQEENLGKTPQQGPTQSWLMTLASSANKPSKTFDELMSTPIDFSAYIMNILKITNLTQETRLGPAFKLLKVTWLEVMRKNGYGYLREIEVRRANNDLYTFKEGDFLTLRINDIEDILILIVQNRLTNLLGNDVFDFAIALQMFTKSMVIQKRVKDL
nr:hypothetical protein [Tanacetum cinerariifolium]